MIPLPSSPRVYVAAGVTDMRKGFDGLSTLAGDSQEGPVQGHPFVFRGRRGDLAKVLWWDGQGFCLFAKRLDKGRFVWLIDVIARIADHPSRQINDLLPWAWSPR